MPAPSHPKARSQHRSKLPELWHALLFPSLASSDHHFYPQLLGQGLNFVSPFGILPHGHLNVFIQRYIFQARKLDPSGVLPAVIMQIF